MSGEAFQIDDTIAAISTAYGPAGIGIIRISGPNAAEVADRVFQSKKGITLEQQDTYRVTYGYIKDRNGQMLDEALALTMWAPHSFTGENIVELQCHGGAVVLKKVLDLLLAAGARLAEPGEFSKRAFLNGRLDLSQAEAIMDVINAKTETALQAATNNLQGRLAREIKECRQEILELIAYLEADIDFPEEDIERLHQEEFLSRLQKTAEKIKRILQTFRSGRIIREGLKTVLIGKPNVGKSSLLNTLLQAKRAIVTDIPGTTRDTIEEYYNLGGIPLVLIDTAGIRQTEDLVEKLGVAKTKDMSKEADLILYLLDLTTGLTSEDREFLQELPAEKVLVLVNKVDLMAGETDGEQQEQALREQLAGYRVLFISATERIGIKELEEAIQNLFFSQGLEIKDEVFLTNIRHKRALDAALEAVESARQGILTATPADFLSIDLQGALTSLGEITGETVDEEIIHQIFAQFCLGK
jgi:tRNA modification GTPase